jgi:hypothetical protein
VLLSTGLVCCCFYRVLALVSVYSPPHAGLFEASNGTVLSCTYRGEADLKVIDISSIVSVVEMSPKLEHLLDSSCYSITYPPSSESDNIPHSPTGTMIVSPQQHSPFFDLPPYYPGSQHALSLDEHDESEPNIASSSTGSDYVLPALFPPYYPGTVTTSSDIFDRDAKLPNNSPP